MSTPMDQPSIYKKLRDKAEAQLRAGTSPSGGHGTMGVDALRLLHRLSSNPEKADDALKFLHELQVHQVELDLQHEEIAANEQALADDLGLYETLYECAPFAYCVVDPESCVIHGNLAAAELFGVARAHFEGQHLDAFLNPQDLPKLLSLLATVARDGSRGSCLVESGRETQSPRQLLFQVTPGPVPEQLLLVCYEPGNAQ